MEFVKEVMGVKDFLAASNTAVRGRCMVGSSEVGLSKIKKIVKIVFTNKVQKSLPVAWDRAHS